MGPTSHADLLDGLFLGEANHWRTRCAIEDDCGGIGGWQEKVKQVEDRVKTVHVRRMTAHARVIPPWVDPEHPSPPSAP
jgi:hypothetical protein